MFRHAARQFLICLWMTAYSGLVLTAQQSAPYVSEGGKKIPAGSNVFVSPMPGGFETYLVAGLVKKKVPLAIVADITKADYQISGISETVKAGWAKMLIMGTDMSREQASIKVVELKTGEVVFGYTVHKGFSIRGKQSAAESCAKHLKNVVRD